MTPNILFFFVLIWLWVKTDRLGSSAPSQPRKQSPSRNKVPRRPAGGDGMTGSSHKERGGGNLHK